MSRRRILVVLVAVLASNGCSSRGALEPLNRGPLVAQVVMATETSCDIPSVRLDSIKSPGATSVKPFHDPFFLKPGKYKIAVACQNPLNETTGSCHFWGHPNEYPTYAMPLKAGVMYTFHCYEVGSDLEYRITESDL